jgi:ATP-dependent DNA helicase RecG
MPETQNIEYKSVWEEVSFLFRSGFVESWGRGISKIEELCVATGLPAPQCTPQGSDFWVTFRKDIYNAVDLGKLGLSERQIKAVLYVKEKGKITNSEYQKLNETSERTASREISELVKANLFEQAGSFYKIKTPE